MKKSIVALTLLYVYGAATPLRAQEVVVYMRDSLYQGLKKDLIPLLNKNFKDRIIVKPFQGQALIQRLKHEKNQQKADLVVGFENNFAENDPSLMATLAPFVGDIPSLEDDLAPALREKHPSLIPFCYSYFAFLVHDATYQSQIKSLEDFIASPITTIIPDPRTSDVGFGFLLWMHSLYGDRHREMWKKLKKKVITFPKGWQASYMLFLKNQAESTISYTTSELAHATKKQTHIKALFMQDGHAVQIWSLALTHRGAQNATAVKLAQFFLNTSVQSMIPEALWSYPAIKIKLSPVFEKLQRPKALIPPPISPEQREKLLATWMDVMMAEDQ
ncbi:MAG: thiamine ABC transporter substrate-binding protein [Candidatus Nucleicultricaceae bacterium]